MRYKGGFTLIETLVVLAVAAILLSVAIPSMRPFVQEQRARTTAQTFMSDLVFARGEAARGNTRVTVTAVGGNWANGWTIVRAGMAEPLRSTGPVGGALVMCATDAALATQLTYRADGRLVRTGGTLLDAILVGWHDDPSTASDNRVREIRINLAGRPEVIEANGRSLVDAAGNPC
ncbi:prepilin-type N-terminal cleavage/methylation domain-containing protein [Litorivicinus lipolyticus]|uniref:Type II secretion system protein H n=1 Tax=Litorivicinus lipolyticus TaxID=418701 RepID=A0A5Q2QH86_9GAMM|nr:GspH/FimT family pseudopilin [Litorivicinus lipolyticus]QGG81200.1 prepilin-type N-terminal cleavage/methylation domain-containing protein [Litorivicinus lipolyticus]